MSVKLVDIHRAAKQWGKYPPLFTFRSVTKIVVIVKKSSPKNLSADCRPTVGRQLTDSRPTVDRQVKKLLSVQKKVVLLQCIDNQISQWRLAVRNVGKAESIKSLVHKFQAYCSHASKCLQLRHGALYKASRHHHDNIHMPLYSRNKNGMVCSWYFLLGKWL